MVGVTTIFIAIGAMTQTIIEFELGDAIGKRRKKRMIDKLKDHYIICGFGRVGRGAAAELLHAGVPFVVVDSEPERVERAMLSGMLAVSADATRDETLHQVGIERARGLVTALATDADNLFVLLSAKGSIPRCTWRPARLKRAPRRRCGAPGRTRCLHPTRLPATVWRSPTAASCGAVSGFHHQGHRHGYQHRTGAGGRRQRSGRPRPYAKCSFGRNLGVIVMAIRVAMATCCSILRPTPR